MGFIFLSLCLSCRLPHPLVSANHTHMHLKNTLGGPTAKLVDCLVIMAVCVCGRVKRVTQFKIINQVV